MHPPRDDRTHAVVQWPGVPGCSACFWWPWCAEEQIPEAVPGHTCRWAGASHSLGTSWSDGGPAEAGPGSLLVPAFLPCQPNSSCSEMGQGHGRRTGKFSCLLAAECSTGLLASSLLPAACSVYHFKILPLFIIGAVVILWGSEQARMSAWHQLLHRERLRRKEETFLAVHCSIFPWSYLSLRACLYAHATQGLCLLTSAVLEEQGRNWCAGRRVEGMCAAALQCWLCGSLIASLTFTFSNERIQKEGTSPATQCEFKKPSLCPPLQGRCLCKWKVTNPHSYSAVQTDLFANVGIHAFNLDTKSWFGRRFPCRVALEVCHLLAVFPSSSILQEQQKLQIKAQNKSIALYIMRRRERGSNSAFHVSVGLKTCFGDNPCVTS